MKTPSPFASLLEWWWNLTAPSGKLVYRGRVTSLVMIVIIVDLILGFVSRYDPQLYVVISVVFLVDLTALIAFNRRGKIFLAGLIITVVSEVGLLSGISQQIILAGQIDFSNYIILPLLIQPVIIAVSILSESAGIIIFFVNMIYVIVMLTVFPKDQVVLHHIAVVGFQDLIVQPAIIYIAGLFIPFIFIRIYTRALGAAHLAGERENLDQEYMKLLKGETDQLREMKQSVAVALARIINQPADSFQFSSKDSEEIVAFLNVLQQRLLQARNNEDAMLQLIHYLESGNGLWTPTNTLVDAIVLILQNRNKKEQEG